MRVSALIFPVLLVAPLCLRAQAFRTLPCSGENSHSDEGSGWLSGNRNRVCELRETVVPLRNGELRVKGMNGGIEVLGEDRTDVALEAKVVAQGGSREEAEALAREVKIDTQGLITAEGPKPEGLLRRSWSVSYKLHVPRHLAADLSTVNGAIALSNVEGSLHAETTNGGLALRNLAGDVHAQTVNGGVAVVLAGNGWSGAGLRAKAVNGGVSVALPANYSAHLVASTVNGGLSHTFPSTGRDRHHLDTNVGQGGATIQLETTNGGVSFEQR